eukprot:COSAG02_NODE_1697_length_11261_cov_12.260975_2_plen_83_part_00
MPARRKRKSSEAAVDAEAANKRAGVTVGNVATAVQRLEAAEVEAPPRHLSVRSCRAGGTARGLGIRMRRAMYDGLIGSCAAF